MRNLKRVLSLALALVMVLGLMVITGSAASKDFDDSAEINENYVEAIDVLTGIGIIEGDDTGNLNPTDVLSREEAAKIITYLVLGKDAAEQVQGFIPDFDDVEDGRWSAGYIAYCANTGYIAGYGDGNFGPTDDLTGVAFAKLLLVALGYDSAAQGYINVGPTQWAKNVAIDAVAAGLTLDGVLLSQPLTREQAIQMAFQALQADTVSYKSLGMEVIGTDGTVVRVGVLGPYAKTAGANDDYTEATTTDGQEDTQQLVEKLYPTLVKTDEGNDKTWGRPYDYTWDYGTGNKAETLYTAWETPKATYTTAVTECQIAADAKLKKNTPYTLYTNGVDNATSYTVQPTDTVQTLGAQGTLVEVYEDEIVVIDTFLAKVVDVKDATYDAAGHLKTNSSITLQVYTTAAGETVTQENGEKNYTYSKGDYVLVNAYTVNALDPTGTGDVTVNSIATKSPTSQEASKIAIIGVAETLEGAQTYLWGNVPQHTIDGTNYDDAKWFKLDQAGTETAKHTWYFDSYGNLIGATDIATIYDYGIVENIQWQNPELSNGYALATIRYIDGTTDTKTVTSIDGKTLTYKTTDADPDFGTGIISTSLAENTDAGKDLYRITTSANGSVALEHVFTDAAATTNNKLDSGEQNEITSATIKTGFAAITGTGANGTNTIYVNSKTTFLVQTKTGNNKVSYSVVTGYENIGNYTGTDVVVDWVKVDNDAYADYVYITGTPASASTTGLFYLTSDNVKAVLDSKGGIDYYEIQGIADGVAATIKVDNALDGADDLIDILVPTYKTNGDSNLYRLFAVDYTNGIVTNVRNSNSAIGATLIDPNNGLLSDWYTDDNAAYNGLSVAAWHDGTTGNATWNGEVLALDGNYYNVIGLNPVFGTWSQNLSDKQIYVIYDSTVTIANAYVAKAVYIADPADSSIGSGSGNPAPSYAITGLTLRKSVANTNFALDVTTVNALPAGATVTVTIYKSSLVDGTGLVGTATVAAAANVNTGIAVPATGNYYANVVIKDASGNILDSAVTAVTYIVP